ncbi:MAG: alpha/beta hydrolase [Solirubrobacteraceae bacterium]|nr:alpha/beta hydrolase [Solirubrobacteraceae bacterium]
MHADEIHESSDLAGRALGSFGSAIKDTHLAISGRVFRRLGPTAAPVQVAHDAISALAYGGVKTGLRHAPRGAGALAALRTQPDAPSLADSVGGALALGALNAAAGDRLVAEGSKLAVPMQLRAGGHPVDADAGALARAYPDAAHRVVVFVHGLGGNEDVWRLDPFGREGEERIVYGDLLRDELGVTPVYLRYNTGRRISDNGRDLSALLEALVEHWPVRVDELAIVGHSMGGLVARAACHVAARDADAWLTRTKHVVCLGSPHAGAPLERGANLLGHTLRAVPETRPWGEMVNARSVGIKDLRYGAVAQEDWDGHDPDEPLRDRRTVVLPPPGVVVHVVSACVTADRDHPLGRIVGDVLVHERSAAGPRPAEALATDPAHHRHLDGAHHWTLLSHPDVGAALCGWLGDA